MTDKKAAASQDVSRSTNEAGTDKAFDKALAEGGSAADHGTQTDLLALDADAKITPPIVQTGAIKPPIIGEPNDALAVKDVVDASQPTPAQEQADNVAKK